MLLWSPCFPDCHSQHCCCLSLPLPQRPLFLSLCSPPACLSQVGRSVAGPALKLPVGTLEQPIATELGAAYSCWWGLKKTLHICQWLRGENTELFCGSQELRLPGTFSQLLTSFHSQQPGLLCLHTKFHPTRLCLPASGPSPSPRALPSGWTAWGGDGR